MAVNLSEGILLAALCPFSAIGAAAFVPSHALFGVRSNWAEAHCPQQQCRSKSGPRQRGRRRTAQLQMMDADMDTEASSSTIAPGTPVESIIQFDNRETSVEVDSFLGELNFCLASQDSVLSGPSLTKALNTASNKIVKNLLILNSPEDDGPAMRDADNIESTFESEHSESPGYAESKAYLSCVCQLAKEGCPSQETLEGLSKPYKMAFSRIAGVLSDFGCDTVPGKAGRVRPADRDISLSILDYAIPEEETTKTRALNTLANRVVRTVCVGSDEDLQSIAREMDSKRAVFMKKWIGGTWKGSQEDMFYDALVNLVRNGLTEESPALHGAYLNSYERLVGIVVQEVGTRSTPASEMVLKSFLAWEREIRKELTEPAWEPRPPDLVGSWALETAGWDGLSDFPAEKSEMEDLGMNDLVVAFRKDGTVQVPTEKGLGLQWRVEPGPTHLDTIYFEMIPSAPEVQGSSEAGAGGSTTLSYTGYVDRGARIEARFSKRFLKMTGRMTSVVRGQERPSTRFAMRLVARGEGKGLTAMSD